MSKRVLIGFAAFIVIMIVDKLIAPIPDLVALILEAICVVLIVTGAIKARKAGFTTEKDPRATVDYDPEKQEPVIRSSICTGEKAAGFKDKESGKFTEVMLIKSPEDERLFMEIYKLDEVVFLTFILYKA